jgi:hypothetical protein
VQCILGILSGTYEALEIHVIVIVSSPVNVNREIQRRY